MMKKNLITILALIFVGTIAFITGCDKKLDVAPIGTLDQNILANQKGVDGLLIGAYSLLDGYEGDLGTDPVGATLSNWVYGDVAADNAYKGTVNSDIFDILNIQLWRSIPTNAMLNAKWIAMYIGV